MMIRELSFVTKDNTTTMSQYPFLLIQKKDPKVH